MPEPENGGGGQRALASSVLNKTRYKRFVLEMSKKTRAHRFRSVSEDFINEAETALRLWTMHRLHSTPSKGKTIK